MVLVIFLRRLEVADYPERAYGDAETIAAQSLMMLSNKMSHHFLNLDALLLPECCGCTFPVVHLTAIMAGYLKLGQPVRVNHTLDEGEWVRVTEGDEKKFIGLAIIKDGLVAPKRLVVDYRTPITLNSNSCAKCV